jgi:hypothetical protein
LTASLSESTNGDGRSAPEPTSREASRRVSSSGLWSRFCRAAIAVVADFGRYGPGGDYYLFERGEEEEVALKGENLWPRTDDGPDSTVFADPYGLIYRWRARQENESLQSPSSTKPNTTV